jgi:hypothetical protein
MLKKWIDEVRVQSDLYKSDCWKYHLSGNVIELSVLPAYMKQKESYRCSVIAVGQVLQALSTKIEQEDLNFHIQSFPSLENPEIVASIRMDEKGEFTGKLSSQEEKRSEPESASDVICNLAKEFQLETKVVDILDPQLSKEIPFKDYNTWLIVQSVFNNPFTWLKIGYLVESLRNKYFYQSEENEDLYIADLCSSDIDQYPDLGIPENKYLQSLIGIQPANISAG